MPIELTSVGRQNIVQGLNGTEVGPISIVVPHLKLHAASLQPMKVIDLWAPISIVALATGATADILPAVAFKWYRLRKLILCTDATNTVEVLFGGVSRGFIGLVTAPSVVVDFGDTGFALGVLNQALSIKNNSGANKSYFGSILYNELS